MQRQRRVQLRDAETGHVHEQADEEERLRNRRDDGNIQKGRRQTRGIGHRRGSPRGLGPRLFRRVRFRRNHGRQIVEIRPVQVPEDQGIARS